MGSNATIVHQESLQVRGPLAYILGFCWKVPHDSLLSWSWEGDAEITHGIVCYCPYQGLKLGQKVSFWTPCLGMVMVGVLRRPFVSIPLYMYTPP